MAHVEEPAFTITYQLDPEEFWEAQRVGLRARPAQYWLPRVLLAVCILLAIALLALGAPLGDVWPLMLLIVAWLAIIYWLPRRRVRKQFDSNRSLRAVQTVEISSAGLHFHNELSESRTSWNAFIRCVESDTLFVLFASNTLFYTLPKRAFGDENVARFRALVEQHVYAI